MDLGDGQRPHAADGVHGLAAEVDAGLDRAVEGQEPLPNTLNPLQNAARRLDDHDPDVATRVEPRRGVDQATEQRVVDDAAPVLAVDAQSPDEPVGGDGHACEVVTRHGRARAPRRTASRRPCRPNEVAPPCPFLLRESGRSGPADLLEGNGCGDRVKFI